MFVKRKISRGIRNSYVYNLLIVDVSSVLGGAEKGTDPEKQDSKEI